VQTSIIDPASTEDTTHLVKADLKRLHQHALRRVAPTMLPRAGTAMAMGVVVRVFEHGGSLEPRGSESWFLTVIAPV
jgi:hypothetical protein